MSTYALGDIQGCLQELLNLLDHIQFNGAKDQLWFVGDLVNRGPDSLNTLRFIKSLGKNTKIVLGNHDLHLLSVICNPQKLTSKDTFTDILNAPDKIELCDWLRHQSLVHYDPQLNYLLVHAGIPPIWNLAQTKQYANEVETVLKSDRYCEFLSHLHGNQPNHFDESLTGFDRLRIITNYFTRLRFCTEDGTLELKTKGKLHHTPPGFLPWFKIPNPHLESTKIIFGHWAAIEGVTGIPNIFALDTGCVWGNSLTALRLEDQKIFSVACKKL